jgi:exosortase K
MKQKVIWSAQLALVGLCALALKSYYSTATADELRWILAPTTTMVELLSRKRFEFESYAGYMSSDRTFVIAVPCAGVNFLITAFLMLALRRLWRERLAVITWRFIPFAALLAYVVTLIANTTRIWLALELREQSVGINGLTGNQLHRLEGIVVYFTFLLLLFVVTECFESAKKPEQRGSTKLAEQLGATPREKLGSMKPSRVVRLLPFPLLIYYATTLGVPLLNGSVHRGNVFWEHSVFVLVLPLLLIGFALLLSSIAPLVLFTLRSARRLRSYLRLPSAGRVPKLLTLRVLSERRRRGKKVGRGKCEAQRSTPPPGLLDKKAALKKSGRHVGRSFSVGPSGPPPIFDCDPVAAHLAAPRACAWLPSCRAFGAY